MSGIVIRMQREEAKELAVPVSDGFSTAMLAASAASAIHAGATLCHFSCRPSELVRVVDSQLRPGDGSGS